MTSTEEFVAPRRRAPGMSPEARRKMIIQAALPLLAEHGASVTTSRIARAAGIGEATVFRAFTDKEELIAACVAEAVDPDHIVGQLAEIPLDQTVEARLTEAAAALGAHFSRLGAILGSLHASGCAPGSGPGPKPAPGAAPGSGAGPGADEAATRAPRPRPDPAVRERSHRLIRDAVADLLEPDSEEFRLPSSQIAEFYLGMLFARSRPGRSEGGPPVELVIDILLNGALAHRS